jgi:predicted transcriptional regulator YheO
MRGSKTLAAYVPVAASISALLHPHGEVVLHDLASGKIAGIWNAMSGRRIGDASLLDEEPADYSAAPVLGPYEKTGPGGARLKSVTAVLPGAAPGSPPAGLLCINLDVSQLDKAAELLAAFVTPRQEQPPALFRRDWRETTQARLHAWLKARGLSAQALTRPERVELIAALDGDGLFEARRAVEHVAEMIGASRAAAYGYLAEARAQKPGSAASPKKRRRT